MTTHLDPRLVRGAKRALPRPVKDVAGSGLRAVGMLTSPLRRSPDFMLIGAKRCGSTSLWTYLLEHPQVAPLFPAAQHKKGTHWFDRHPERSAAWYRSHFPLRRPGSDVIGGEASTYYFTHPHAARRAAQVAPEVKVIALLREPVARAFSHYRDEVKLGHESLSFAEAIAREEERVAPELARLLADPMYYSHAHEHLTYLSWGHYAEHLRRWYDVLPAEQILVLQSEDLFADPAGVFHRVTGFLGLRPFDAAYERHNAAPSARRDDASSEFLREHYAPHNAALRALLPDPPTWA